MEWISIKDHLPDPFTEVLVRFKYKDPTYWIAWWHPWQKIWMHQDLGWWNKSYSITYTEKRCVTHWMPLPEAPS